MCNTQESVQRQWAAGRGESTETLCEECRQQSTTCGTQLLDRICMARAGAQMTQVASLQVKQGKTSENPNHV